MEVVWNVLAELFTLVPPVQVASVAVLIAVIINVLKQYTKLVPDGSAPRWNAGLNFAFWLGLVIADQLGVGAQVQSVLDFMATIAPVILAPLVGFLVSNAAHQVGRANRVPFFGPRPPQQ